MSLLHEARDQIEAKLAELLSHEAALPYAPLFSSARYSLIAPAKRLRPLLAIATAASYGVPLEHALIPACAIEFVHTYSLIHDDLPCMDNDDMRRGRPTLHKMVPEWHALLTGDYLLTYAFELLASAPHLSSDQKIALVHSLSTRSGAHGMIGGQMIDLLSEGKTIPWKTLEQMHRGKTASLIVASLEFGAIMANAPMNDIVNLREAGMAIGIAFQLIDDVLDCTGTAEELGKLPGSDQADSKATAVTMLGISSAKNKAEQLKQTASACLQSLSRPAPLLEILFEQMIERRK